MTQPADSSGQRCRPAGTSGPGRGRRGTRGTREDRCPVRTAAAGGTYPPGSPVRVRFTPSPVPVLTCTPARHEAALRGAAAALARLGRSDLGGSLEVSASGDPRDASAEHLAAQRAVENALRGGCGTVLLHLPPDPFERHTTSRATPPDPFERHTTSRATPAPRSHSEIPPHEEPR